MDTAPSLAVWAGETRSGILARERALEYVFAYPYVAGADAQVSLTMPPRLESRVSRDLHPIFQMNLPEGARSAETAFPSPARGSHRFQNHRSLSMKS